MGADFNSSGAPVGNVKTIVLFRQDYDFQGWRGSWTPLVQHLRHRVLQHVSCIDVFLIVCRFGCLTNPTNHFVTTFPNLHPVEARAARGLQNTSQDSQHNSKLNPERLQKVQKQHPKWSDSQPLRRFSVWTSREKQFFDKIQK